MKILNDSEHRIFLSAMSRERKVCSSAEFWDEFWFLDICDSIERKVNDAEPVVRCKDCKHCYVNRNGNVSFNECELNHNHVQADDWFCADGERKGGE